MICNLGKGINHCGCALWVVLSQKVESGWIPQEGKGGEVEDGQLCLMVAKRYMNTSNQTKNSSVETLRIKRQYSGEKGIIWKRNEGRVERLEFLGD